MIHVEPDPPRSNDTGRCRRALLRGGDLRIAVDPGTGRNMYGVPPEPASTETWLSSSTAGPVTRRGLDAASGAFERWRSSGTNDATAWASSIRERLLRLFGIPGAEAVLCPSGTDAELIVLALAMELMGPAITNIVLAPGETGRGVPLAAAGLHTSGRPPLGSFDVSGQAAIAGFSADIDIEAVDIREADGTPRSSAAIGAAVHRAASMASQRGRGVLLHCLDVSKTGLSAYPVDAIAAVPSDGARCLVVVDACQLRCPAQRIRDALRAGQVVIITGSKFAGGPPFSGAVLLPPAFAGRLATIRLPGGMRDYCALSDWPDDAREALRPTLHRQANAGLLLRWEAALVELERLAAFPASLRNALERQFQAIVTDKVRATPGLSLLDRPPHVTASPTIVPVATSTPDGRPVPGAVVQAGLARSCRHVGATRHQQVFRVGQPVKVGEITPVRICLSAPQLSELAERYQARNSIDHAFEEFDSLLTSMFEKWSSIGAEASKSPESVR